MKSGMVLVASILLVVMISGCLCLEFGADREPELTNSTAYKVVGGDAAGLADKVEDRVKAYGTECRVEVKDDVVTVYYADAASEAALDSLLLEPGVFEAKIEGDVIFTGGEITDVCRTPECSRVSRECSEKEGEWFCQYAFRVMVTAEAAKRFAVATQDLEIVEEDGYKYLSKNLELYLDGELVDSLQMDDALKGREIKTFEVMGKGKGATREDAEVDTLVQMRLMQAYLTAPWDVKLEKIG